MKFRIFVRITEALLALAGVKEDEEYDVHLPNFLLAFGFALIAAAVTLVVAFFFVHSRMFLIICPICLILGVTAIMCRRNQKIKVLSDEEFEYTTFLGATHRYRFSDIIGLRQNKDSMTLFVGNGKVHIESIAIVSERFATLVNEQLSKKI